MWSNEAIRKHQDKVANPVFVYKKEDDKMTLIQIFNTTRSVGLNLGLGKSFYSSVRSRTNGWYKDSIYFTDVELENTEKNRISLLELSQIVEELREIRIGFGVRVTDVTTGEVTDYASMQAVSRAIGIDNKGIKDKSSTGKLYKKRFKFECL